MTKQEALDKYQRHRKYKDSPCNPGFVLVIIGTILFFVFMGVETYDIVAQVNQLPRLTWPRWLFYSGVGIGMACWTTGMVLYMIDDPFGFERKQEVIRQSGKGDIFYLKRRVGDETEYVRVDFIEHTEDDKVRAEVELPVGAFTTQAIRDSR